MLGRGQRPLAAAARAPLDPEGEADGMSGSSRSTHHNRSDRTARPRGAKRGSKNGGAPGKHARRNSDTSWERAADWYDGWVGAHGSVYHRRVALPATLELLALTSGERLLDIGAGQGVLAPDAARRGAAYVGVESEPPGSFAAPANGMAIPDASCSGTRARCPQRCNRAPSMR